MKTPTPWPAGALNVCPVSTTARRGWGLVAPDELPPEPPSSPETGAYPKPPPLEELLDTSPKQPAAPTAASADTSKRAPAPRPTSDRPVEPERDVTSLMILTLLPNCSAPGYRCPPPWPPPPPEWK